MRVKQKRKIVLDLEKTYFAIAICCPRYKSGSGFRPIFLLLDFFPFDFWKSKLCPFPFKNLAIFMVIFHASKISKNSEFCDSDLAKGWDDQVKIEKFPGNY